MSFQPYLVMRNVSPTSSVRDRKREKKRQNVKAFKSSICLILWVIQYYVSFLSFSVSGEAGRRNLVTDFKKIQNFLQSDASAKKIKCKEAKPGLIVKPETNNYCLVHLNNQADFFTLTVCRVWKWFVVCFQRILLFANDEGEQELPWCWKVL